MAPDTSYTQLTTPQQKSGGVRSELRLGAQGALRRTRERYQFQGQEVFTLEPQHPIAVTSSVHRSSVAGIGRIELGHFAASQRNCGPYLQKPTSAKWVRSELTTLRL
jgi:hypothetical protein